MRYPPETHLKPKYREISFACSLFLSYAVVYFFIFQSFSLITAVLCAKFQNDWTTETDVMA